ncbi:hypothetical protein SAMN05444272_3022 [Roseibium suaedae]|uniref:Uncharacterized protein n=1 Tax=Roseibium suaedae TaxID=735517 RepID=A0A1M7KZ66_9HYPH|nr:hypothetical protein SAMN05444272_3022 [Roseibium suaedae]
MDKASSSQSCPKKRRSPAPPPAGERPFPPGAKSHGKKEHRDRVSPSYLLPSSRRATRRSILLPVPPSQMRLPAPPPAGGRFAFQPLHFPKTAPSITHDAGRRHAAAAQLAGQFGRAAPQIRCAAPSICTHLDQQLDADELKWPLCLVRSHEACILCRAGVQFAHYLSMANHPI